MKLLVRWVISALAVAAAVYLVDGIRIEGEYGAYLGVAVILGLVNALVRPLLSAIACGLIFLTMGLFLLVINAGMLMLTGWIAQGVGIQFSVDGFGAALLGSIVISVISYLASLLLFDGDR